MAWMGLKMSTAYNLLRLLDHILILSCTSLCTLLIIKVSIQTMAFIVLIIKISTFGEGEGGGGDKVCLYRGECHQRLDSVTLLHSQVSVFLLSYYQPISTSQVPCGLGIG